MEITATLDQVKNKDHDLKNPKIRHVSPRSQNGTNNDQVCYLRHKERDLLYISLKASRLVDKVKPSQYRNRITCGKGQTNGFIDLYEHQ